MNSDAPPFEFNEVVSDVNIDEGKYSCPICHDFASDSIRSVKGHISGSKDERHVDLGWNYEDEIRATADDGDY